MSHFTVGVIVSESELDNLNNYLNNILEPYNENVDVEPYSEQCWCIGTGAYTWANDLADRLVGNYHTISAELRKEWKETRSDYVQYHSNYGKPMGNCEDCKGTGIRQTTYNPNSKWDWWVVGGRWDGALPNEDNIMLISDLLEVNISRRPTLNPEYADHKYFVDIYEEDLARYESTPEELRDLFTTFAMILPDGSWQERGEMGWFAIVSNEKPAYQWARFVHDTYTQYKDHYLVLLDCHI